MPLPLALGRFNTRVTNRIIGPILVRFPWYGWLFHVGRRTGRQYRTPIMLFVRGDRGVIALTYGERTQWLKNVLAAGSLQLRVAGGCAGAPGLARVRARPVAPAGAVDHADPAGGASGRDFLVLRVVTVGSPAGRCRAARPASTDGGWEARPLTVRRLRTAAVLAQRAA